MNNQLVERGRKLAEAEAAHIRQCTYQDISVYKIKYTCIGIKKHIIG